MINNTKTTDSLECGMQGKKKIYVSPMLTAVSFRSEKGYAASGIEEVADKLEEVATLGDMELGFSQTPNYNDMYMGDAMGDASGAFSTDGWTTTTDGSHF